MLRIFSIHVPLTHVNSYCNRKTVQNVTKFVRLFSSKTETNALSDASTNSIKNVTKKSISNVLSQMKTAKDLETPARQPRNEGHLHFRAKQHLMKGLRSCQSLNVYQICNTRQEIEFPTLLPHWTCTNKVLKENFISGWNHVETEYHVRDIGRFDVALLRRTQKTVETTSTRKGSKVKLKKTNVVESDEVIGVIEVLSTSKMTDYKVQKLGEAGIPWVEVKANSHSIHHWNNERPLIAYRCSTGSWWCHICDINGKGQENFKFISIPAVVDLFPSRGTRNGYGQMHRKVFAIFESTDCPHDHHDHEGESSEHFHDKHDKTYCLVVGNYNVVSGGHIHAEESFFLGETYNSANYIDALYPYYEKYLRTLHQKNEGNIIDVHMDWPGKPLEEFFDEVERTSFIDLSRVSSPQVIYPSIERYYRQKYWWNRNLQKWQRYKNPYGI